MENETEILNPLPMEIPKPSMIRNYLYEYVLIAFAAVIVTLFTIFMNLNKYVRDQLVNTIENSTKATERTNEYLQQLVNQRRYFKGDRIEADTFYNQK